MNAAAAARRRTAVARAGWGAVLVTAPSLTLRALGGRPGHGAVLVVRLLGVRHLAQAALSRLVPPTGRALAVAVAADAAHAASMAALSVAARRWRRPARRDAVIAATWMLLGVRDWLLWRARSAPSVAGEVDRGLQQQGVDERLRQVAA